MQGIELFLPAVLELFFQQQLTASFSNAERSFKSDCCAIDHTVRAILSTLVMSSGAETSACGQEKDPKKCPLWGRRAAIIARSLSHTTKNDSYS